MTPQGVPKSVVAVGLVALALLMGGRITACSPATSLAATRPVPSATATSPPANPPKKPPVKPATPIRPAIPASRNGTQVGPVHGVKKHVAGGKNVALTFDDGPSPYTPQLLDQLRAQHVKATFCLVGTQVQKYPQLVARIVREGHTLCNHSWHHELDLGKRPIATIQANLARTNAAIRRAVPGAVIRYYRQPGGEWTPNVVAVAKSFGMTPLGWSVDPSDWRKPPAGAITARVLHGTHGGAIVLMHDGGGDRTGTMAACRTIIPTLKKRYHLVLLR
jgi:peptidoglycan/xylan/chitin deacetylase (PgdA/CDA1 family)